MENRRFEGKHEPEIVYSRSVKAGKRIYYLDVKKARNEDLYLCITESKKRTADEDVPTFEKHKVFLYKEDFKHFTEALSDVIGFVENKFGEIEERQAWIHEEGGTDDTSDISTDEADSPIIEDSVVPKDKPRRRGPISRLVNKYRDKE